MAELNHYNFILLVFRNYPQLFSSEKSIHESRECIAQVQTVELQSVAQVGRLIL